MKTRKLKTVTAGLAVAVLVGYGLWRAAQPAPEFFQGQMEATETDITPKITGRIGEILVKKGDRIVRPLVQAARTRHAGAAVHVLADGFLVGVFLAV